MTPNYHEGATKRKYCHEGAATSGGKLGAGIEFGLDDRSGPIEFCRPSAQHEGLAHRGRAAQFDVVIRCYSARHGVIAGLFHEKVSG